ncbi:MAG: PAS domain S-box protein [Chloroflexi bacterium]|nr:PAS domain S-box protein [Chloroflexota bacterium]
MLSETGDMLVVKALVMPDNMNKAVHALEKIINIKSVGYSYRLAAAHIDREVLETNQALYLENNYQKLLQVFPDLGFLGRQALRPFSGQPGIVAPITLDGKVQGTLYLASAQLQPEDISIISIFANQIANALQEAHLLQNIQQTEAQYRRLFETANDAILVLDVLTERIISANPKALALTGYTLEELYTLSLETLFPLNQFSAQVRLLKNDLRHRAFITEAQVQNRGREPGCRRNFSHIV